MIQPFVIRLQEANLLRQRIRLLLTYLELSRHERSERIVHDLRVSSRRLREIISYLDPLLPREISRKMRRSAKLFTQKLGATRETEVNLKLLEDLMLTGDFDLSTLELLIFYERKRLRSQSFSFRSLDRKAEWLGKILIMIHGSRTAPPAPSQLLFKRLEEFRRNRDTILAQMDKSESDDNAWHDLRIKTKKLRYSLEIYSRLEKKRMTRLIGKVRKLQQVLGDMHDFYVLSTRVASRKEKLDTLELQKLPQSLQVILDFISQRKARLAMQATPLYESLVVELTAQLPFVSADAPTEPEVVSLS